MANNYLSILEEESFSNKTSYITSVRAREILNQGRLLSQGETYDNLLERVVSGIFSVEHKFGTQPDVIRKLSAIFTENIAEEDVMLGTPILTNAGRYASALSSCANIPVDLRELNDKTKEQICSYYRQNMGAGFDFTPYNDPVALLNWVNELSLRESATGAYDRYIGNMGILQISHPSISEFIDAKRHKELKHFNISIDVTEEFMWKAINRESFALFNGTEIDASDLLDQIVENAWHDGDPGLVFLERMNKDNAFEGISRYITTPPCGEMGLAEGETCHFGYINLRNFIKNEDGVVYIDYDWLRIVTQLLTRVLDNAIEYSIPHFPNSVSAEIAKMKRKIGIGVCGLADMFLAYNIPYDSPEARSLARDTLSFINYVSKCASVELAEQRGSCLAMNFPVANKYLNGRFLEEKYAKNPTSTVSSHDWVELANTIRKTGKLRNFSTTALPPSGRVSILLDVTPSIEPIFSIFAHDGNLQMNVVDFLAKELNGDEQLLEQICQEASRAGSFQYIEALPLHTRECLKTAKEIAPIAHVQMVADVAGVHGVTDESASKTVNLPNEATVNDVKDVFLSSFHYGLKSISIYRDKTKIGQPMHL